MSGHNVMELSRAGLYRGGDWLLFGAETTGLPEPVSRQLYAYVRKSSQCNVAITIQVHDREGHVCYHVYKACYTVQNVLTLHCRLMHPYTRAAGRCSGYLSQRCMYAP